MLAWCAASVTYTPLCYPCHMLPYRRSQCCKCTLAQVNIVLQAGVHPDRIVYANACKRPKDIRAAASLGVSLTTFDTHSELQKLARWHPDTAALLRIRADDPAARCQLGNKYGAEMLGVPGLLEVGSCSLRKGLVVWRVGGRGCAWVQTGMWGRYHRPMLCWQPLHSLD